MADFDPDPSMGTVRGPNTYCYQRADDEPGLFRVQLPELTLDAYGVRRFADLLDHLGVVPGAAALLASAIDLVPRA